MSGDHTNNVSWCGVELQNVSSKERHFLVVQIWYYIGFCQFMIFPSIFMNLHIVEGIVVSGVVYVYAGSVS